MTRHLSARAASWLIVPMTATLLGCGAETGDQFLGSAEFLLTVPGADGKAAVERVAARPKLTLRRGQRGGTDVVLDRSCALRSQGGSVTGTYSCRVGSAGGALTLELQSGTWQISEQPTTRSSGGCPVKRYTLVLDAAGTIRGKTGATAMLHFEGQRELKVCTHSGGGVYGGIPWSEDPYTGGSDWVDGYDWDGDGDWDGSGGTVGGDWGGDDESGGDDGDWGDDDGSGDDGDWGGDDGGGDDGGGWGGDDGGGGDDGDWATGHSGKAQKARKPQAGQLRQARTLKKVSR